MAEGIDRTSSGRDSSDQILSPAATCVKKISPSVTAVLLALSSLTLIDKKLPAVLTGTSFTAWTVIDWLSLRVSTPLLAVPLLSLLIQVQLPRPTPFPYTTLFRSWSCASVTVPPEVTCVVPSAR